MPMYEMKVPFRATGMAVFRGEAASELEFVERFNDNYDAFDCTAMNKHGVIFETNVANVTEVIQNG